MAFNENEELKEALNANLHNVIKSLTATVEYYEEHPETAMGSSNAALIIIANELHNISNTLKSIDERLKNE